MVTLLFFRGATLGDGLEAIIPLIIRLLTWPKGKMDFKDVPAHVAITITAEGNTPSLWMLDEWEATIRGIGKTKIQSPDTGLFAKDDPFAPRNLIAQLQIPHLDESAMREWLDHLVGTGYGYASLLATGAAQIGFAPSENEKKLWHMFASGRTAPRDCSQLCADALEVGGLKLVGRNDGFPPSPADLYLWLKETSS